MIVAGYSNSTRGRPNVRHIQIDDSSVKGCQTLFDMICLHSAEALDCHRVPVVD